MNRRSRGKLGATTAIVAEANVIDNKPDLQLARRLAGMQVSKSIRFGTTRRASGAKPSDIREKRTP
jgi:hypothetical protein